MKVVFTPEADKIEDIMELVSYCYDRGLEIHMETVATGKSRKKSKRRKVEEKIKENIKEDAEAFRNEIDEGRSPKKKPAILNKTNGHTVPEKKHANKARVRIRRKARGPEITEQIYNAIRNGDTEMIQKYSPQAIAHVTRTKSWPHFLALKARKAKKSRDSK